MMNNLTVWPNFFIVGVAKAGTTSLYEWLAQHPQIYMSAIKEPHYFTNDLTSIPALIIKERGQYLKLFAGAQQAQARGEASASYFPYAKIVAPRIAEVVPDARIIVLLRDPIERAHSDYVMYGRQGRESMSFYDALQKSKHRQIYIQKYAEPLHQFLQVFRAENVLVLMFEDMKHKPRVVLQQIARFLHVDETSMQNVNLTVENTGGIPRGKIAQLLLRVRQQIPIQEFALPRSMKSLLRDAILAPKPAIDAKTLNYLRPLFDHDVTEVEKLLGRSLPELRRSWQ